MKKDRELLDAAKAVIDLYDYTGTVEEAEAVNRLVDAVERAGKPSADFMGWWKTYPLNTYGMAPAFHGWEAGQQAERERLRQKVAEIIRLEDFDDVMAVFSD